MAEMEKLKADQKTFKAFASLEVSTKILLKKAYNAVNEIEAIASEDIDGTEP